jgi:predicted dehydrogenase
MASLNIGVIGAGMIARGAVKSINQHDDVKIVAAFDPDAERLASLQELGEITRTHNSRQKLLEDDELDAVYVAVPNKFHAETARAVLQSGRHCLLEKPFALSYAEAKSVVDAADESGKTFMLGMNQRFGAGRQRVRRLVRDGVLGEIYHAKGFWMRRGGIPKLNTWFGHKCASGGGCMLDIGVHMLDLTMWLADNFRPTSVLSKTYTKFGPRGIGEGGWGLSDADPSLSFDVDDFASALVTFENGMTLAVDVSWAAMMEVDSREGSQLFGTEAGASVDPAKLHRLAEGVAAPQAEADGSDPNAADVSKSVYETLTIGDEGAGEGSQQGSIGVPLEYEHCNRFHNFINAVLGREAKCCLDHEVLTVQKVLDAIYESSRTGRQVDVTPEEPKAS